MIAELAQKSSEDGFCSVMYGSPYLGLSSRGLLLPQAKQGLSILDNSFTLLGGTGKRITDRHSTFARENMNKRFGHLHEYCCVILIFDYIHLSNMRKGDQGDIENILGGGIVFWML